MRVTGLFKSHFAKCILCGHLFLALLISHTVFDMAKHSYYSRGGMNLYVFSKTYYYYIFHVSSVLVYVILASLQAGIKNSTEILHYYNQAIESFAMADPTEVWHLFNYVVTWWIIVICFAVLVYFWSEKPFSIS